MPVEDYPSRRALRGETVSGSRYRLVTSWATAIINETTAPVRDADGRIVGAVAIFRDIAEQFELEMRREQVYAREHRIAEVLQQALIPQRHYDLPGLEIASVYRPASDEASVGGDFYDVFELSDDKVGILIGDVAGKGLQAAMWVSAARHAIRSYAYLDPEPALVMTLANEALSREDIQGGPRMLTAFFAVVDCRTGRLTFANAGHEPPLLRRPDGDTVELTTGGRAPGLLPGESYTESSVQLSFEDLLVMFTDGITEARTSATDLFGKEGVMSYLASQASRRPNEVAEGLLEAAYEHSHGAMKDDVAILVLRLAAREETENTV